MPSQDPDESTDESTHGTLDEAWDRPLFMSESLREETPALDEAIPSREDSWLQCQSRRETDLDNDDIYIIPEVEIEPVMEPSEWSGIQLIPLQQDQLVDTEQG
ncbi:hypothetical protein SARC_06954 [Sphaeroforma arctica JP610]|uniref:Uncharacterized protein n=1 Tax=Sphaeroforma arctica JP610 TaxID=667725 RepID=A0A0L0FV31_9EUKA|nr:hypothetical protein SARC_06954 [Sphaeroforma arctica JP610]KNC80705.1 hypothetical protein SARC_06954 [Sphaeroforma arctica JP610]|eukprot:XP_014154607.1 hypothetical protein SARC_06954 [Sphaeroforma arctica JP610]